MKKTRFSNFIRGKFDSSGMEMILEDGSVIKPLKDEELYKFLGILENYMHDTGSLVEKIKETIQKRASVAWTSPLSDFHKVQATNVFVLSCLGYFLWTEKFNITDLRDIDKTIREIMNVNHAKYKLQANCSLYLPRSEGGRGLKQAESMYKVTRVKAAMRLLTDDDVEMKLVKEFDKIRMEKNRSSVIGDAVRYCDEDFNMELIPDDDGFTLKYEKDGKSESTSEATKASKLLKDAVETNTLAELDKLTWQGATMKHRKADEKLVSSECFAWARDWKNCPVEIINDIQAIYLQVVPTRTFQKYRGQDISNTTCRMCNAGIENVQHLLSSCEYFLKFYYTRKHNNVLKYIYFNVLKKYGLVTECPPWYSKCEIKAKYENDQICLLWDIPEYMGYDDEEESKVLRPDGKMILKNEQKVIILEMSVPWIQNRESKLIEKEKKYRELIPKIQEMYPNFECEQATFIIDCLGGYSSSYIDALKKVGLTDRECKQIVRNTQKIVVTEGRSIVNKFKMLAK